jgi:hypothetical protein
MPIESRSSEWIPLKCVSLTFAVKATDDPDALKDYN